MKSVLVVVGWLLAVLGLYAGLVGLEYYWNVPDWQPYPDSIALALAFWIMLMLFWTWFLARASKGRLCLGLALLPCLALLALAVYVAGPEPLKSGFLGREAHSPVWYRGGRVLLLCLPAVFWVAAILKPLRSSS
jgi:hypothetical protein